MPTVLLCAPAEALVHPELMGLEDVDFETLDWLRCSSLADEARVVADEEHLQEIWIRGCDDMDALNLAAALRKDSASRTIMLIAPDASGSLRSRAQAAEVNEVLALDGFVQHFSREKERHRQAAEAQKTVETICEAEVLPQPSSARTVDKQRGSAYVLTILSGSGGAGKSTIAAVAAHIAAAKGHRVLLFDCDLQFGDAAHMCGETEPLTSDDVLEEPERLDQLAKGINDTGLAILGAPTKLERAEAVTMHLPQIMEQASNLFDVVVINTGANWAECHAMLIEQSDCALFLMDQKASSVRACKHAIDLCERLGIAIGNFEYAMNRCRRGGLFSGLDAACALQGAHVFELKDGGIDVEELLGTGNAAGLVQARNDLCLSVSAMLDDLLPSSGINEKHRSISDQKGTHTFQSPIRRGQRKERNRSSSEQASLSHSRKQKNVPKVVI